MANRPSISNDPTQQRSDMDQSDEVRGKATGMDSESMDLDEDEFEDLDEADEADEDSEGNF